MNESEKKPKNHQGNSLFTLDRHLKTKSFDQRKKDLAVSTSDIVDRALSFDRQFEAANQVTLTNWDYRFSKRYPLSIRTHNRVSQITDAAMQPVRRDYCRRLMMTYGNRIDEPHYLINMDETAVFLNCIPNRTVYMIGEKTISVMIEGTKSMRFKLAISVAMDGTKLPFFVIFKATPGGSVAKQLPNILPYGIVGYIQAKGWIDDRTMGT